MAKDNKEAASTEMGNDPEEQKSWYEKARCDFRNAAGFDSAVDLIWNPEREFHGFYQHYTTLSRVITKLAERKWWLSRSDSENLNDRQESLKFGVRRIASRTYQSSFCHGAAESAALWSLYAPSDPFAIRITISGEAMKQWVVYLRGKGSELHGTNSKRAIESVDFSDIVYAAVAFRDMKRDSKDVRRGNRLYWSEVNSSAKMPNLEDLIHGEKCTCRMKDYEWRHERESRLIVRTVRGDGPAGAWVKITRELINDMKFTFSPWLDKRQEKEVQSIITTALHSNVDDSAKNQSQHRFRRSVLQGALNLDFCKRCDKVKRS